MSHASPRVETATNRLHQELFARLKETPAYDLGAMATNVNRMGYFKSAFLRIREAHQYPLWNTAFGSGRKRRIRHGFPHPFRVLGVLAQAVQHDDAKCILAHCHAR